MPIKTSSQAQPTLNLTPMLDVVFLLIIFFMVGTKFAEMERRIEVDVPAVGDASPLSSAPEKRVINVTSGGEIYLDETPVTMDALADELVADVEQYPQQSVLIRSDASSSYQRVADVLSACKHAGVANTALSVKIDKTVR